MTLVRTTKGANTKLATIDHAADHAADHDASTRSVAPTMSEAVS